MILVGYGMNIRYVRFPALPAEQYRSAGIKPNTDMIVKKLTNGVKI